MVASSTSITLTTRLDYEGLFVTIKTVLYTFILKGVPIDKSGHHQNLSEHAIIETSAIG